MKVLSLFDGVSCGRLAFERAGIPVEKYYASEIDKYAIQVAQKNYPDTMQIGDVTKINFADYADVNIVIGGSPCQDLSIAKQNREGLRGARSGLFWKYVEALETIHPKYFLLENVASMRNEDRDAITETLRKIYPETECIMINSASLSAQQRKRYYWTNWHVEQPQDKGILLKDILHEFVDVGDEAYHEWLQSFIVPFDQTLQILDKEIAKGKVGYFRQDSQANRVYYIHDKAVTLCGDAGGGAAKMGQYLFGCITPDRVEKRQNGQRFNDGQKFYTLTAQDRRGVLVDGYIRKLTPIECERLQTLPDAYTAGISNSQRYKCLGNGWTVDVIAHILKAIKD